ARLTKRQARDMIATLTGTDLPAATLDALVARADGVPLYVEELTKAVMEPGAARGVEAIPASLADSLMGRLDRLSTAKEEAQRAAQASAHYQRAGERATRRSANEEAINHLRRALALVGTLPETRERHRQELGLQMAIGAPLIAARGWAHPEYERTFARARE